MMFLNGLLSQTAAAVVFPLLGVACQGARQLTVHKYFQECLAVEDGAGCGLWLLLLLLCPPKPLASKPDCALESVGQGGKRDLQAVFPTACISRFRRGTAQRSDVCCYCFFKQLLLR